MHKYWRIMFSHGWPKHLEIITYYIFMQESASSYMSNVTQQWWRSHFSEFWDNVRLHPTTSSPNVIPQDFTISCILENDISKVSYRNITTLKETLVTARDCLREEVRLPFQENFSPHLLCTNFPFLCTNNFNTTNQL